MRHNRLNMMNDKFIVECLGKKWNTLWYYFNGLLLAFVASYILFVYIISKVPPGTLFLQARGGCTTRGG